MCIRDRCKMFASSFYMDYNNVGRTADNREQTRDVTVWVATSQDLSLIHISQSASSFFLGKSP